MDRQNLQLYLSLFLHAFSCYEQQHFVFTQTQLDPAVSHSQISCSSLLSEATLLRGLAVTGATGRAGKGGKGRGGCGSWAHRTQNSISSVQSSSSSLISQGPVMDFVCFYPSHCGSFMC